MKIRNPVHIMESNGFKWSYDENGAHFFVKKTETGYLLMRCLPADMTNKNFQFMAEHGLTNTNKAKNEKSRLSNFGGFN